MKKGRIKVDGLTEKDKIICKLKRLGVTRVRHWNLGYVHTNPDKFENAPFFLRIGLSSLLRWRFR